jgi:hypothetical protein
MLNIIEGNEFIKNLILNKKNISLSRIGIGELQLFNKIISGGKLNDSDITNLNNFGGFYGDDYDGFINEYIEAIKNSDIHCFWAGCGLDSIQNNLFSLLSSNSKKIHHRAIEPYYSDKPWTESLINKKVLVINPFSETIQSQYNKRLEIWTNKNVLPNFELITYKSVMSMGDLNPHSSWTESLEIMKSDISKIDFDIALLGCSTYGLPLVNFISKKLNKSAIYIGGAIQIMFGIKGERWDNHPEISSFYNESWVRPSLNERPNNYRILEGGTYW